MVTPLDELLPLTPAALHIGLVLAERARHGYGIMQAVSEMTGGRFPLGPGTLYRSLQRMQLDGLVDELVDVKAIDDERRRTYRLTQAGLRVVRAEVERLAALVAIASERGLLRSKARK